MPTNFEPHYLGSKKLLTVIMDPAKAYSPQAYLGGDSGTSSGTLPGWPKAGTNKWELRTYDIIDLRPLPALGDYCYSHRVFCVDRQTKLIALAGEEGWDRGGRLYKTLWTAQVPYQFRGHETTLPYSTSMSLEWDFQNKHATANSDEVATFDETVPTEYRDFATLSTPSGIASVLR